MQIETGWLIPTMDPLGGLLLWAAMRQLGLVQHRKQCQELS